MQSCRARRNWVAGTPAPRSNPSVIASRLMARLNASLTLGSLHGSWPMCPANPKVTGFPANSMRRSGEASIWGCCRGSVPERCGSCP